MKSNGPGGRGLNKRRKGSTKKDLNKRSKRRSNKNGLNRRGLNEIRTVEFRAAENRREIGAGRRARKISTSFASARKLTTTKSTLAGI
jgi:hypothetical protein